MNAWDALLQEVREDKTLWLLGAWLLTLAVNRVAVEREPGRLRIIAFFVGVHCLLVPVATALRVQESSSLLYVRLPALVAAGVALAGMAGIGLFMVALPRVRVRLPKILQDIIVSGGAVVATLSIASNLGLNLSGLIATSAVLTAVIGFSLQDSLANVAGGLALQVDDSIRVGDWVKLGDVSGQVRDIRWRYTAIETRNRETAIVPNAQLMKSTVLVVGRRGDPAVVWRRWVYFNVDFRYQPSDVVQVAQDAVRAAKLERVAQDPLPTVVLMDLHESYGRYAVRYFLTDPLVDDPTDSEVRTCVYFALRRAGIPLSIPAHAIFMTEESGDRRARKQQEDLGNRVKALRQVELFADLSDAEREQLARGLRYAPFTRGEVLTRQGAEAHWLYLMTEGQVSVRVSGPEGLEREVAVIQAPGFFGEMSLMTGEKRSATVVALMDIECFRLDKAAFQEVLQLRPAIANEVAGVLARRKLQLEAVREGLDQEATLRRMQSEKDDLLGRIRSFFSLDGR